jgi:hypothetical protein
MNDFTFAYWSQMPELAVKLKFLFSYFNQALNEDDTPRRVTFYKENINTKPTNITDLLT